VNQGYDVVLSGGIPPNTYPAPVTLTGVYPGFEFSGGSASGYPPGGSSTNTQYRVTSTTFGGETEIYIAPSGDASGATDQTNIAAAITAACASGPPSPISIKLGSGIFYVTGDFPVGCPFDFQGAGKGNTFIEFVTTSSNFITANYGGGALNYESYGAMWSDFSLLMKSGVTAASGDAFILSGLNDEHYLAQLHINRVAMYGLWGGFSTGANMVENWFEHNYCAFFVSGGDGCLSYDTVQPGGDFHFDFNEAVGPYTGYTVLQGDVLHFNGNKLNGSPFLFYSNTSSIIDVLLTDESYEGTQACGIDFGTGGARIANVVLSSVEIGAGPVYGTTALCHVTNPQLTGLSGCYSFSAQNGGAPTCIGAPYNPNQLATYNFSVVENPLSYSGMFTAAGTGASLPQVPSAGICEPASTSSGSSAVATGFGSWPNSQSTAVVLAALGGQGTIGLILRASATTETLYQVNLNGSANLDVYAVVAGSAHQIGSTAFIPTANQMWEASVVGTTSPIINVYLNGALFYSVTDTTYGASITSGSPGFAIGDSEAITDTQISSWTGGSAGGTILATSNLSDWTNSGVANGYVPSWDSTTGKWTPISLPTGSFTALTGDATSTSTGGATEVTGLENAPLPPLTTGFLGQDGSGNWYFGTSSGPTIQTKGTNNSSQSALNFLTSSADVSGLTVTPSNPSAGGERMEVSGTYSGAVSSSQVTTGLGYTPANCTAGTSASDCLVLDGSGLVPVANLPKATATTYGTMEGTSTTAGQVAVSTTTAGKLNLIDFPQMTTIPAANCVAAQPGSAWSTTIAPSCRAGTYNLGGNLPFADASTGQFEIAIPADWDSAANSYARLDFTTGANTSGTIIFQIQLSCYLTNNSQTDDQAFETAQVFSTVTAGSANYANTVTLTLNSTSLTGCAAGGGMIVKITRNTDTASAVVPVSKAIITLPRKLVLQAE
jgi:hypothetical protein